MDNTEKRERCKAFYEELRTMLAVSYISIGSCNRDFSEYLVPIGMEDQVSYYSKPYWSFRISDHWNWYANLRKCKDEDYIQCFSVDLPLPGKRLRPRKASRPVFGVQVALFCEDGKYHCVYGDKYDPLTKKWTWNEADPIDVVYELLLKQ